MNLSQLALGQEAIIQSIDDQDVYLKLLDLGCLPGELVRLEFIAPFGDPLYLDINGSHLAIRIETAREIEIEIFNK